MFQHYVTNYIFNNFQPLGFSGELCIGSPSSIYQEQSNWSILTSWHSSTVFRAVQSGQEKHALNYVVVYQLNPKD